MRILVLIFLTIIITSCKESVDVSGIEKSFQLELPDCYTEQKEPLLDNYRDAETLLELVFEEECFNELYNTQISDPYGYCEQFFKGPVIVVKNRAIIDYPRFENYEDSVLLLVDFQRHILHYEDYTK